MSTFETSALHLAENEPLSVAKWTDLVNTLLCLEQHVNELHIKDGWLGIGTEPTKALHIKGDGGSSDDILLESTASSKSVSGALIMERHRPNAAPLSDGDMLGLVSLRTRLENQLIARSEIRAQYSKLSNSRHASSLSFLTTRQGSLREIVRLSDEGEIQLKGNVRGGQAGGSLQIQTNSGYIKLGPNTTSFAHILTDRGRFFFNKKLVIDSGDIEAHNTHNLSLMTKGVARLLIRGGTSSKAGYIGIQNGSPETPLHLKGLFTLDSLNSKNRGWIVMRSHANDEEARRMLNSSPLRTKKNVLVIGGVWDNGVYFYWKDNRGRNKRAIIRGTSF